MSSNVCAILLNYRDIWQTSYVAKTGLHGQHAIITVMCDDLPNESPLFLQPYTIGRHSASLITIKDIINISFIENSKKMIKCGKASANALATLNSQPDGKPKSESSGRTETQHSLTLNGEEGI